MCVSKRKKYRHREKKRQADRHGQWKRERKRNESASE